MESEITTDRKDHDGHLPEVEFRALPIANGQGGSVESEIWTDRESPPEVQFRALPKTKAGLWSLWSLRSVRITKVRLAS